MEAAKQIQRDFDVMVESKQKDKAALQLVEDLAKMRGYKRRGGATIQI